VTEGRVGLVRLFTLSMVLLPVAAQAKDKNKQKAPEVPGSYLVREVGHELRMLPFYTVFDNLEYKVEGYTVILSGQVTQPVLKSDAENVVKRIEGVERVVNNIQVLPLSPNDDRLRRALYRAIYGQSTLNRYALQAIPPIHIIVDNGHVTLVGVVANEMDKNIAGIQANGVPGVFSVTNNLRVEAKEKAVSGLRTRMTKGETSPSAEAPSTPTCLCA
jgi:hyperosmotically inducible protein